MKVGIDAQLARGTATGIGEYVAGLISALRTQGRASKSCRCNRRNSIRGASTGASFGIRSCCRAPQLERGVDLLHCASGTLPAWRPDASWSNGARRRVPARAVSRSRVRPRLLRRVLRSRGIAPREGSWSTRAFRATNCWPAAASMRRRVDVVYPGVSADLFARPTPSRRGAVRAGRRHGRGAQEPAPRYRARCARCPVCGLISTGPFTPYRDECLRIARKRASLDRVEFRGYVVARGVARPLRRARRARVVPSRYEGFGYGCRAGVVRRACRLLCANAVVAARGRAATTRRFAARRCRRHGPMRYARS